MTTSSGKLPLAQKAHSFTRRAVAAGLLLIGVITVQAQTNLIISSFDFTASVVWSNALAGHTYAVQRAAVLETGVWSNVPGFANVAPTGSTMTAVIPVSGPMGFYRVLDNGSCCPTSGGTNPLSAVTLGSLCGDTTGAPIVRSGCGGGWFRVTLSECSGAAITLQATVTLTSPGTADYDLYLYNTSASVFVSSTQNPAAICFERPDVNGEDTFDVLIEVRPFNSFGCDHWSLDIRRTSGTAGCSRLLY